MLKITKIKTALLFHNVFHKACHTNFFSCNAHYYSFVGKFNLNRFPMILSAKVLPKLVCCEKKRHAHFTKLSFTKDLQRILDFFWESKHNRPLPSGWGMVRNAPGIKSQKESFFLTDWLWLWLLYFHKKYKFFRVLQHYSLYLSGSVKGPVKILLMHSC